MKILILNGSPRPNGQTAKMCHEFKDAAEAKGHEVDMINVTKKNIRGCLACEYCHGKGNGNCVQKDDIFDFRLTDEEMEQINNINRNKRYENW